MSTDIAKRFGKRLRQLREEKGMLQRDLAEKAGIETEHLSRLENGHKEPCLYVIDALATSLRVSLRQLFWNL